MTDNLEVVKSFVKNSVGLLIAVGICSGITVASSLGMFSKVEKNFYEPARLAAIRNKLDSVAEYSNEYISNILRKTGTDEGGFLSNDAVATYFAREPSREAGRLFGKLLDEVPAIDGLRVVERNGKSIQYSSFKNDSKNERGNKTYSDYPDLKTYSGGKELPYSVVSAFTETDEEETQEFSAGRYRIVFDGYDQRIIISYPYYYNDRSYSFVFYINPIDFVTQLVEQRIISINEEMTLISSKDGTAGGFVFRMPRVGQALLANEILRRWYINSNGPDEIASSPKVKVTGVTADEDSAAEQKFDQRYVSWNLITSPVSEYFKISGLYSYDMLTMPQYIKILLLICSFITVCLIIIILFNIRKDDDVVILSKIKSVQIGLLNEFFEKNVDRAKVAALIESQKDVLTAKIKKSLGRRGKRYGDDLSIILNQSWQDIINILSGDNSMSIQSLSTNDMSEIRRMFEDVMSNSSIRVQAVTQFPSRPRPENWNESKLESSSGIEIPLRTSQKLESPAEDVEELEEAEPVEELSDAEEVSEAEPVEELNDAEEVIEAEPVEELSDAEEVFEAEPVEEMSDAQAFEKEYETLSEAVSHCTEEVHSLRDFAAATEETEKQLTDDEPAKEEVDGSIECLEYADDFDVQEGKERIIYSSPRSDVSQFEGTESLVIGDSLKRPADIEEQVDNSVADDFVIYNSMSMFEDLNNDDLKNNDNPGESDETGLKKNDSDESFMNENKKKQNDDVMELESVSKKSEDFMFTTFAANDNNVTELSPDAIVQDDEGVFSIADDVSTVGIKIDEDFKKLVDSVLR